MPGGKTYLLQSVGDKRHKDPRICNSWLIMYESGGLGHAGTSPQREITNYSILHLLSLSKKHSAGWTRSGVRGHTSMYPVAQKVASLRVGLTKRRALQQLQAEVQAALKCDSCNPADPMLLELPVVEKRTVSNLWPASVGKT